MYPKIGERYKVSSNRYGGQCIFCQRKKADARLIVEVNNFRGDDFVYKVHWNCIVNKKDSELMQQILSYWEN